MKTYRLFLVGATDRMIYGIKEYEAANEEQASQLARRIFGDHPGDLMWGGQRIVTELRAV